MPLFTGMAVLTLALGIGANTAIFSVISGVLLKPLPYPQSDDLVALDHAAPGFDIARAGAAPFLYFTYREDGRAFEDVALWNTGTVSVTGLAQPEEVPVLFATDGLLPILGVQPLLGRAFSRTDDTPAGAETVVLTAGYWRSKLGADRAAVGRVVTLDGKPAGDHRRAARYVPVPRPRRVDGHADADSTGARSRSDSSAIRRSRG